MATKRKRESLRHTAHGLEHDLKQAGDEIADGLTKGFGDLVALAEQGILDDALDKIADYAEKAAFDGSAPIPLRTAFLDIEVTDAKALARGYGHWLKTGCLHPNQTGGMPLLNSLRKP